jgi:hypothetical protein
MRDVMYSLYVSTTAWGWTERELFSALSEYLTSISRPTGVHERRYFRLQGPCALPLLRRIDDSSAYLVHNRTGNYRMLVCEDWVNGSLDALRAAARDRRCHLILKQQYRASAYGSGLQQKLRPWTYTAMLPTQLQPMLSELRRMRRSCHRLYWRGNNGHGQRAQILEQLQRHSILGTAPDATRYDDYCLELCKFHVALSLPGWGNLCHREIEAFGVGTPVLMPRLLNQLHDELVPDYHYISVNVHPDRDSPGTIADAIVRRYREVADRADLLQSIAAHAMAWYDRNAAFPAALRMTVNLLELPE